MNKIFANIWTKRVASIASVIYCYAVCFLCYCSLFYAIEIKSNAGICLLTTGVSIIFLVAMIYSRKQILTRIASMIMLPAMLPVVLFYFGEWYLIIPIIATSLIIFLLSGAGEAAKTAFGTIFLLLYIFGSLGYFLMTSIFATSSESTVVMSGVSPSKLYRYYVLNTKDSSNGSTALYVEPNNGDLDYKFVTFRLQNMERVVCLDRPITEKIDIQWIKQSRQEITTALNAISSSIVVHLSEAQLKKLGYTYEEKLMLCDLEATHYNQLGLVNGSDVYLKDLSDEQLALFKIAKNDKGYYISSPAAELLDDVNKKPGEKVYLKEMDSDWLSEYYIEKDDSVLLNTLSDADLEMLGVPESGDVLIYNGKTCFRYYVAILEDYFDLNDKQLTLLS